jgi:hypothetical protein
MGVPGYTLRSAYDPRTLSKAARWSAGACVY